MWPWCSLHAPFSATRPQLGTTVHLKPLFRPHSDDCTPIFLCGLHFCIFQHTDLKPLFLERCNDHAPNLRVLRLRLLVLRLLHLLALRLHLLINAIDVCTFFPFCTFFPLVSRGPLNAAPCWSLLRVLLLQSQTGRHVFLYSSGSSCYRTRQADTCFYISQGQTGRHVFLYSSGSSCYRTRQADTCFYISLGTRHEHKYRNGSIFACRQQLKQAPHVICPHKRCFSPPSV